MPSHYEELCRHLSADELSEWDLIHSCIEKNYSREVSLRVGPLRSDALCADFEHRFDLAALLRDLGLQIAAVLEREKSATVTTELQDFLAKLRDRERAEAIEHLQDELLHLDGPNNESDGV